MKSVAIIMDGYVYGVLLMEGEVVKRAWFDPDLPVGTYQTMTFSHDDPAEVMKAVQKVLDVRYIPEVAPSSLDLLDIKGIMRKVEHEKN